MLYFKHYGTMRNDYKIKKVILKYGIEGYGLYNLIVEIITESLCETSPIPLLQETPNDIESFYGMDQSRVEEITTYMIELGLFDRDENTGKIQCQKVYKFYDQSQTRSVPLRNMIREHKEYYARSSESVKKGSRILPDGPDRLIVNEIKDIDYMKNCPDQKNRDFAHEWERLLFHWNSKNELPQYKILLANESNAGEIKNWMVSYSYQEMEKAIDNYADLLEEIKRKNEYPYQTFRGFIKNGIARFFDGANPRERYYEHNEFSDEEIEKMKNEEIL